MAICVRGREMVCIESERFIMNFNGERRTVFFLLFLFYSAEACGGVAGVWIFMGGIGGKKALIKFGFSRFRGFNYR